MELSVGFENAYQSISVTEGDDNANEWHLGLFTGETSIPSTVPSGTHIALGVKVDRATSQTTFVYDSNIEDELPEITFGPYPTPGPLRSTSFGARASGGLGAQSGIIDLWTFTFMCDPSNGDFNENGMLDAGDIDLLSSVVRAGTNESRYDLNADQRVDEGDRTVWVESLRRTYFGDSNLDGEFSSADLVTIFQAGQYEDEVAANSTWATGDWNGDAEFTSRDLVVAFQGGGYEGGPRAAHSIPEPCFSAGYLLAWLAWLFARSNRRGKRGQPSFERWRA
jgi:hypothetical protein